MAIDNILSRKDKKESHIELAYLIYFLIGILVVYFVVWAFTGMWPFTKNNYNSYVLQAKSWLEGKLDLGKNYSHLEVASYGGKYYISFPPFPSYIMLPFVLIFGVNTPDNFIALLSIMIGGVYAFRLAKLLGFNNKLAYFWSTFLLVGTNLVFVSINAWVWFIAQNLSFTLSIASIYYATKKKGGFSLSLWACSVGCRPFQIVYLPILLAILYKGYDEDADRRLNDKNINTKNYNIINVNYKNFITLFKVKNFIKVNVKWLIGPAILAVSYMLLNYLRFDNIFEFGHNYLPEFVNAKDGQFSFHYVFLNLRSMFRLPTIGVDYRLEFPKFDGVAFWLVSPIFISYLIYFIYAIINKKKVVIWTNCGLITIFIIHLVLLSAHKTLGGWHFGNRYTNDLLPFLYYGLLRLIPKKDNLESVHYPLCLLGITLNVVGSIAVYNNWF